MTRAKLRLLGAVALALVPTALTAHLVREGARALDASNAAEASGDLDTAIAEARRAATDDVPLVGHQDQGYDRLEALARAAEARGDEDHALRAWTAEHNTAVTTSTAGLRRHQERVETSSRALAHLYRERALAAAPAGSASGTAIDEAKLAADLARPAGSGTGAGWRPIALGLASILVALGIVGFLRTQRRAEGDAPTASHK